MAEILSIHWDRKRLHVLECSGTESPRAIQAFSIDVPESLSTAWLREALKAKGVAARQAVVCLPREDGILRQLELPDAPDDELPMLVPFQAASRSSVSLDQLHLDYITLPRRSGIPTRDVLSVTVPKTTVDPIRATLADAGIELKHLTLTSFALGELLARTESTVVESSTQRGLLVALDSSRIELVVMGDGQVLASNSIRPTLEEDGRPNVARTMADISRVLVPAQVWMSDGSPDRVWLIGVNEHCPGLVDAMKSRWKCPVESLDDRVARPMPEFKTGASLESVSRYAPVIGLALGQFARKSPAFDLLHPHQPKPAPDTRKARYAALAAAGLVLATGVGATHLTLANLDSQYEKARSSTVSLDEFVKGGKPDSAAANVMEAWSARNVNQLNLLSELHEHMQGTSQQYLSEYHFTVANGEALAKLSAKGSTKDRGDWIKVENRMVESKKFEVRPKAYVPSNDSEYVTRFELDADVVKPKSPPGRPIAAASTTNAKSIESKPESTPSDKRPAGDSKTTPEKS